MDKSSPLYEGLPFMEIEGELVTYPTVAEVKFDGEFQYLIKKDGRVYLINKKEHGRTRTDIPILNNLAIPEDSVFTAELIYGNGTDFYEFARHKLTEDNNIAIHGCLRYDGVDIWKGNTYADTRKLLEAQKFYNSRVVLAPKQILYDKAQYDAFYNKVIAGGWEGIVVKDPLSKFINGATGRWVKRKYTADNDFVVMGFETETARAKKLSVIIGHKVGNNFVRLGHCGSGFEGNEKDALLKVLKANITSSHGNEHYVNPTLVITVKHHGIIRNTDGTVSSIRHPSFKTFRLDKLAKDIDTLK